MLLILVQFEARFRGSMWYIIKCIIMLIQVNVLVYLLFIGCFFPLSLFLCVYNKTEWTVTYKLNTSM